MGPNFFFLHPNVASKGLTSPRFSQNKLNIEIQFCNEQLTVYCIYIHFAPPPRLLVDFKNSNWMTYLFLHLICIIMHLLLFLSPDWLIFCHMIISLYINSLVLNLFSVFLWRRANARNVRLYYPYWQYTIYVFSKTYHFDY